MNIIESIMSVGNDIKEKEYRTKEDLINDIDRRIRAKSFPYAPNDVSNNIDNRQEIYMTYSYLNNIITVIRITYYKIGSNGNILYRLNDINIIGYSIADYKDYLHKAMNGLVGGENKEKEKTFNYLLNKLNINKDIFIQLYNLYTDINSNSNK